MGKITKAIGKVASKISKVGPKIAGKAGATAGKVVGKTVSTVLGSPVASRVAGGMILGDAIRKHGNLGSTAAKILNVGKMLAGGAMIMFNHPEWYTNYPLEGMIGANFARRKGIIEDDVQAVIEGAPRKCSIPSVCGLSLALTIPRDNSNSWGTAIAQLYNRIRLANAGAINYTDKDLDHYIISVRSLHAAYCQGRRAFGCLQNFNIYDSTVPSSLFAAMGLDYETFRDNAANLKQFLSIVATQLHTLAPLNIDLFDRTDWLFSNIFADSDDEKASYYVFTPRYGITVAADGTNSFKQLASTDTTGLTSTTTGLKYDAFIENFQYLINSFVNNNVYQVIAGDILKAYGEAAIWKSVIWDLNQPTPIIHDENALSQIQNAFASSTGVTLTNTLVTSNTDFSRSDIVLSRSSVANTYSQLVLDQLRNRYINSPENTIEPAKLLSLTRLAVATKATTWTNTAPIGADDLTFGTEVLVETYAYFRRAGSSKYNNLDYTSLGLAVLGTSDSPSDNVLAWSALDYAPRTTIFTDAVLLADMFDFNNYAKIDFNQLATYHALACMSLLYQPNLVRVSNTTRLG